MKKNKKRNFLDKKDNKETEDKDNTFISDKEK